MCLSTIYRNEKGDDNVLCKFIATIAVDGDHLTFTDVMGQVTELTGHLVSADLTAGAVVVAVE
jgi:predicted RNA-binding protein